MRYIYILLLLSVLLGCSPLVYKAQSPTSTPILKEFPALVFPGAKKTENPVGILTLKTALRLALLQSPHLNVFALEVRARDARTLQNSLLPNPEFSIETENIAGSGNFNGLDAAETTFSLGQLIELAGKREKRFRIAALQSDLAYWAYETARLEIFSEVVDSYTATNAAQQRISIQKEILEVTKDFQVKIDRRVEAGRLSPAEAMRAEVLVNNAQMRLTTLQKELSKTRYRLAAAWNSSDPLFSSVEGNLDHRFGVPDKNNLRLLLKNNPLLARWDTELKKRRAQHDLARADAVPDPVISGAYRHFNESGDNAFVAGISIPLPLFNRNQGAIQEARVRVEQAQQQQRAVLNRLTARLNRLVITLKKLVDEKESIKNEIIPKSAQTLKIISQGFEQGKFQFLDVMTAQQTLFEARERLLDVRLELYQTATGIETLIGKKL